MNIYESIKKAGGKVYLVGGSVRDALLGMQNTDFDFCVTGLTPEEFMKLFPFAVRTGKSFPVFHIGRNQFSLASIQRQKSNGQGFIINKNATIYDDLAGRDITINAMAIDLETKQLIDPFNGYQDLKNKIIRKVSDRFKEDPIRAYRAARLAAKFGFKISPDTLYTMKSLKEELYKQPSERVFEELRKALLTNKPSIFFNSLRDAGLLDVHFKEIKDLIGIPQPKQYHPEGDVYNHTMIVVDKMRKMTNDDALIFAALVHDLGKALTPKEELPHHYRHDVLGDIQLEKLASRIRLPSRWIACGLDAIRMHMKITRFDEMRASTKEAFIKMLKDSKIGVEGLGLLSIADEMVDDKQIRQTVKNVYLYAGIY